ncbi:MAG: PAS domain-containing protein [Promethearchaeota archaeon]
MYHEFLQLILVIPKSLEALLSLIVIILALHKYKEIPWRDRHLLERYLLIAICGWFVYIFFDIFIYLFAPMSMASAPLGDYGGYDVRYPSLFLMNVFRDIAFLGILVQIWFIFFSSIVLKFGAAKGKRISQNWILNVILWGISILVIAFDKINVHITDSGPMVDADFGGLGLTAIIFVESLLGLSILILIYSLFTDQRFKKSEELRKNLKYLILGSSIVFLGYVYWLSLGTLASIFPKLLTDFRIGAHIFGHLIWLTSPFFMYLGFRKAIVLNPKMDEDYKNSVMKSFQKLVEEEILGTYLIKGGKILHVNPFVTTKLQYSAKEILKWSLSDIIEHIHPDDREKVKKYYELTTINFKSNQNYEFRYFTSTHEIIWVRQRTIIISDYAETVYQYIFEDISEQKKVEAEKKTLQGMLPICAHCKKVRTDEGYYVQIEEYISEHSEAEFTHGLCPDCMKKLYPDLK